MVRIKIRAKNIDSLFWQRPSDADPNCPKMGQSQRGVEEGGFEGVGVGSFNNYCPKLYRAFTSAADKARS